MHIKNKKGQSTVEYVLLMTAVVAVIIALVTSNKGGFQTQLNSTLNTATSDMNASATTLSDSHQPAPAGVAVANPNPINPLCPGGTCAGQNNGG